MFKLKKILPLILCMLVVYTLFSCQEEEKVEEPYFPEGFTEVDDYIMPFQTFFNATKGIESEYRERNKAALEFYADPEYIPNVNPYEGKSVNLYPEYVDNYEVEIKKMIKGNSDEIKRITKEIDKLNKRLDSVMEAYELKDYTREQFLKRKHDIETELEKLLAAKTKLEANKEEDKLIQIKKAIPKIEYCINNYYKCDSIF